MPEMNFIEKPWYPVLFVVVLSLVFIGTLAALYRYSEAGIDKQRKESYELTVLGLCSDTLAVLTGKSSEDIKASYPASFNEFLIPLKEGSYPRKAFELKFADKTIAYVFDVVGKGLWGTMRALVATDSSRENIIGLNVYDQMETPGLGARIEEDWFTGQFKQKRVWQDGKSTVFTLIPEEQQPVEQKQIKQVTGATITSRAVLNMLRDEISLIMKDTQKVQP